MQMRNRWWMALVLFVTLVSGGLAFDIGYGNGWLDSESLYKGERDQYRLAALKSKDLSAERDLIVAKEARRAGLPILTMLALSHTENRSGDSMAVNPVSGAVGLLQPLPSYWENAFRAECGDASLYNRERNACVGVRIYKHYLEQSRALQLYSGTLDDSTAWSVYLGRFQRNITRLARSE